MYGFNRLYNNVSACFLKVENDLISAICFRTKVKVYLRHLSYIVRKPETLST